MCKIFDYLNFEDFTQNVFQQFLNSECASALVDGFECWDDVDEFNAFIKNAKASFDIDEDVDVDVEVVVLRDGNLGFNHVVEDFADVCNLYAALERGELEWYDANVSEVERSEIMLHADIVNMGYEDYDDYLTSQEFKPPREDSLHFWFDDYTYYVAVRITKKDD